MLPEYTLRCVFNCDTNETKRILKIPAGQKARWHSHDTLQRVYGTPREAPADIETSAVDADARPFSQLPSVAAAPRTSQRQAAAASQHELVGAKISVEFVQNDYGELVPATALNVQKFGDQKRDVRQYEATVLKVNPRTVTVKYATDGVQRNLNLLFPNRDVADNVDRNYIQKDKFWHIL